MEPMGNYSSFSGVDVLTLGPANRVGCPDWNPEKFPEGRELAAEQLNK